MEVLITAALFLSPGDPLLQKVVKEVPIEEIGSNELNAQIEYMLEIARGERGDGEKRCMVGLAAPQVGIDRRVILVDIGVDEKRSNLGTLKVYINPEILKVSEEVETGREGCYSVDSRMCGIVPRAKEIEIIAWDRWGNRVEERLSRFTARIFQHEVDHLNGIRFPDRVGKEGILHWVEEEDYLQYRSSFENWSKFCSFEMWEKMKQGEDPFD